MLRKIIMEIISVSQPFLDRFLKSKMLLKDLVKGSYPPPPTPLTPCPEGWEGGKIAPISMLDSNFGPSKLKLGM